MDKKYKKEKYIHNFTYEQRKQHINHLLIKEYLKYINNNVLHIGCNGGSTTRLIADYVNQVIGVDIQEDAIRVARKNYPNIKFETENLFNFSFNDNNFGGVYLLDVIEHLYEEDVNKGLKEIKRVMKPKSYMLIFTPKESKESTMDKLQHVTFFPKKENLVKMVEKEFKVISCDLETRNNPGLKGKHCAWKLLCQKIEY